MAIIFDEAGGSLLDESGAPIFDEAGAPAVAAVQGSWWQLLDIRKQAQEEFDWWADNGPFACPHCGEPLRNAPPTDAGSSVEKYCVYDGWQFPRDYVRPQKL